jgi:hypothetical protein
MGARKRRIYQIYGYYTCPSQSLSSGDCSTKKELRPSSWVCFSSQVLALMFFSSWNFFLSLQRTSVEQLLTSRISSPPSQTKEQDGVGEGEATRRDEDQGGKMESEIEGEREKRGWGGGSC